ncbi:MAG: sigma-54 dependent transcriptional regulator [Pseudomonadota bacterium]
MTAILIVDDDEDILTASKLLLRRHFERVDACAEPGEIPAMMTRCDYSVILLDMNFGPGESSGRQGFHWLQRIIELDPDAVVVMITAHGGVDVAVEAMKLGATDFIAKPWQNEKVVATISAAVKLRALRSEARQLKRANTALVASMGANQPMLGDSPAMQFVHSVIERAAPTDANVLILGEHGTGKELAARALHAQSARADEAFMSVDLGAVPETLFESELFGHVKGAFTDAKADKVGCIQAAHGGTLFLDEVGNLPQHLQAKLLTVLEQRQVRPVGSSRSIDFDARVIAATNLPRPQLNDERRFRQDLLFRLNTVEIELPPLRERQADIPQLAEHYAAHYARKYDRPARAFSAEAMSAMQASLWPGNIRALRHAIERATIMATGDELQAGDIQMAPPGAATGTIRDAHESADDLNLDRVEKQTIQRALTRHRYNVSHAARELGLSRAAVYRRMEKHGL